MLFDTLSNDLEHIQNVILPTLELQASEAKKNNDIAKMKEVIRLQKRANERLKEIGDMMQKVVDDGLGE